MHRRILMEQYTDHDHLTIKAGELFIRHIYEHDEGKTLGGSITLLENYSDSYRLGGFKIKGVTKGTVGLGSIEVEKGEIPGDLNRDLNATQTRETI